MEFVDGMQAQTLCVKILFFTLPSIPAQFFAHHGVCGWHADTNSLCEDALLHTSLNSCAVF
jgi:hypothetical protein